ncbi:MAG: 2-hydroxyhepta-2,4-diene-1,7-dioate isomerase, partial [Variovorax sp.]
MKLISYLHDGASHWGCVIDNGTGDGVVDLGRRLPDFASVAALLEGGDAALAQARAAAEGAAPDHALADVRVETPIARPRRIFCIGVNYAHRNAEYKDGSDLPKYPSIFMRV